MAKDENKRESEFDRLLEAVKGIHSKRINAMLVTMEEEEFAVNYFKILEFAAPKLQRREIVEEEKDFKLIIEHTHKEEMPDEEEKV